jgi:hypothetical protein
LKVQEKQLSDLIKSRGYWEIEIVPYVYKPDRIEFNEILPLVEKSQVHKWGRYYPRIAHKGDWIGESFNDNNYYESLVDDGGQHKEMWRMYQSGQFIHYLALREDWGYPNASAEMTENSRKLQEIVLTLFTVTEIFLFVSRLASNNLFEDSINIIIKLHDAYDRALFFSNLERELHRNYVCNIREPITIKSNISVNDILSNNERIAMDTVIRIFRLFNWRSNQIADILRNDQEKILKEL